MQFTNINVPRRRFLAGSAAVSIVSGFGTASILRAEPASTSNIHCDVLVCCATPGGIAAAVTAARRSQHVILVEYEDHMGGILSNGLTNTDLNPTYRPAVGGFLNQFTSRIIQHYEQVDANSLEKPNVRLCRNSFFYEASVAESLFNELVTEQKGYLLLLLRHKLKGTITKHGSIGGAIFENRDLPGKSTRISATASIDATYEGDLAALSNANFRLRRESRSEFNEPYAGVIYMKFGTTTPQPGSAGGGDKAIQIYCFRFSATSHPDLRIPVEKPEIYDRSDYRFLLDDIKTGKITRLEDVFQIYPMPMSKIEFNSIEPSPTTGVPSVREVSICLES